MSIFLRYNSVPITLSRPFETASSRDENGDLKIINMPNQWGDNLTSFAVSGFITLGATSGIVLNTPGFVDVSGLRANSVFAQDYYRINDAGDTIDFFPGNSGSLTYKVSSSEIGTISNFVFNTGINKLTYTDGTAGSVFYVHPGENIDGSSPSRELTTFSQMQLRPQIIVPGENPSDPPITYPPQVVISGANLIVEKIQIGGDRADLQGAILTHAGEGEAIWLKNEYLQADGAAWNRYPKRAVKLEAGRVVFYSDLPRWASLSDPLDYTDFGLDAILEEFGPNDTLAILWRNADGTFDLVPRFVKPQVSISFLATDGTPNTDPDSYVFSTDFLDVDEEGTEEVKSGYAMEVCGQENALPNLAGEIAYGYIFSVTKGAYLSMQLAPDATETFTCGNTTIGDDPEAEDFLVGLPSFKPSTVNNISIRPDIHTSFNALAENIDFVVYGKYPTDFNGYDADIFDLDESLLPQGLTPGFKLDANVPNAVQGSALSGVSFGGYADRFKTIPLDFITDNTPKILINRNNPYSVSSIFSGVSTLDYYASLSVSGVTYSDQFIAEDIYLTPKPNLDNTSKYIANALLTIDSAGKIISRVPAPNPTIASAPTNIDILITGNNECSIKWTAGNDGGSTIVDYIIEFSANNGQTWTQVPSNQISRGTNTQTSCTITGLQTSVAYLFRVIAQNGVGLSSPSDPCPLFNSNYDIPQSPRDLSSYRTFGDELSIIELSWNEPDSLGTSALSGYLIEESDNNGTNWIYHNTISSLITSTSEVIYGLNNANNYLYRISAINASGQGAFNFIYVTGNVPPIPQEEIDQAQQEDEALTNWDFGVILFTGVCES